MSDLLKKARGGDSEALAKVCEQNYSKIHRYIYYRVGPASAEDLTGEVFLRVIRNIEDQSGSFNAWIYRIASNVIVDHYRSQKVRETEPIDKQTFSADIGSTPDDINSRMDLKRGLDELTEEQRQLVVLKFVEGLSNAEVCEVMDRKPGAVRALQYRALSTLHDYLEERGYDSDRQKG